MTSPLPIAIPTNLIAPRLKDMDFTRMEISGVYVATEWIEHKGVKRCKPVSAASFDRRKAGEMCRWKIYLNMRVEQHRREIA